MSLLPISFSLFIFKNALTTVNTHTTKLIKYLPPKLNVMFKFNYSKYNPRELIFGGGKRGLIHGRGSLFQKLVPRCSGAYTRWGLLSEFYGICGANDHINL